MVFTEDEKKLIDQGLDDALNRLATPSWKRNARAAQKDWKAGTADPKTLAEALAPVPASLAIFDRGNRPENYHDNIKHLVKRMQA